MAKVSIICRTHFLSKWQPLQLNVRARYNDVTRNGNVPLYDLRNYEIKIRAILHIRKMGVI